ncbi:MAG: YgfZ/GcvT domain-containing protein [Gemmatimonadales bacterium]
MASDQMGHPEPVLDDVRFRALLEGAVVVRTTPGLFELRGAGAIDCLQGLLTNDVVKPGEHSLVYGALLTPKGMIVSDLWALRGTADFTLILPPVGHAAAAQIFQRTLPPRVVRATDRSGEFAMLTIAGPRGEPALIASGLLATPLPAGRVLESAGLLIARGAPGAPFDAILAGPVAAIAVAEERLGALLLRGTDEDLLAARVIAGWPALGAEIDEKTLPQEVRYDEIGGVSYTKGCYTGQETVARVHFRGHPNRELRGLVWEAASPLGDRTIQHLGREVGTVRSTVRLDGLRVGLAPIRREVALGETVTAGGLVARIVALPFAPADLEL